MEQSTEAHAEDLTRAPVDEEPQPGSRDSASSTDDLKLTDEEPGSGSSQWTPGQQMCLQMVRKAHPKETFNDHPWPCARVRRH